MPRTWHLTRRGMAVAAAIILVATLVLSTYRLRFVQRSVVARGDVIWNSRWTIAVTPEGDRSPVIVRKPLVYWFYRIGQSVRIRYDPQRHVPGSVAAYGRIDSFVGLWLGPVLLGALTLVLAYGALAPRGSDHVHGSIGFE